jgi:hypothetical protein
MLKIKGFAIPPAAMAADPDRLKEARFFYTIEWGRTKTTY